PDASIFENVRKLPPGHYLRWSGGRAEVQRYWHIAADEPFTGSEQEAAEELRAVLHEAVRCHMISDVPLGAFLSGGVDSSGSSA
ncbi:MAG TPA: asparagine synthase-related protein, partial [Vicinamibacterales bacterium]